jgi:hypothetical protein
MTNMSPCVFFLCCVLLCVYGLTVALVADGPTLEQRLASLETANQLTDAHITNLAALLLAINTTLQAAVLASHVKDGRITALEHSASASNAQINTLENTIHSLQNTGNVHTCFFI